MYGNFEDNAEKYFEKACREVLEADKQQKDSWTETAKREMKKPGIRSNAQFLLELRYPSEVMIKMNKEIIQSITDAGFGFFDKSD